MDGNVCLVKGCCFCCRCSCWFVLLGWMLFWLGLCWFCIEVGCGRLGGLLLVRMSSCS